MRRWRVSDAPARTTAIAAAINLSSALLAIGGFVLLGPRADFSEPILVAALAGIAAVAYLAEARLKVASQSFFGATLIVALVALAVAGPLAAMLVWAVPDLIARFVLRREPRLSPGLVATVSSYALAALAGAELLELAGAPSGPAIAPALYTAGVAMWALNFAVARLAFAPFYQGYRPAALIRDEFVHLGPAVLGMLVVGVVAALLVGPLGLVALGLLAAVILVPQLALERLVASRSVASLDPAAATRLYAGAIADVLAMPRRERRELDAAARILTGEGGADRKVLLPQTTFGVSHAAYIALHVSERWDGHGWPAGLPAEATPRESRVLAVGRAWSTLTARGGPELPHSTAMLGLAVRAGSEFDPSIVRAAARVVAEEEAFVREPAFQPRFHRMPLPRKLRRGALAAVGPRLAQARD